jgi:hypothetical protein
MWGHDIGLILYPNSSSRLAAAEPLFKFGLLGFLTAIPAASPPCRFPAEKFV